MRDLSGVSRVVVKIGTSCLTSGNSIDTKYVREISRQISHLLKNNLRILVVTSGAIGMGAAEMGLNNRITNIKMRQACAAIGQPLLMQEYRQAFREFDITVAQVLLTTDVLNNRKSYLNLRNSVETLLSLGAVPVFNENDSISTDEIGSAFGDNDTLSAYIASKVDADLLILLSDIDALYDRDPRKNKNASAISTVSEITDKIIKGAGNAGSPFATGGMVSKLQAVEITRRAGCLVILAHGREDRVIERIIAGEELGTLFLADPRMSNRQRWILNSKPAGSLTIDQGAMRAIRSKKSLLPSGIVSVDGVFKSGDVVVANEVVKMVTAFNSSELESILGKHSSQIRQILGEQRKEEIARPENMVFLD